MTLQRRSGGDQPWTQASNTPTQEQYVPARGREFFPRADASFFVYCTVHLKRVRNINFGDRFIANLAKISPNFSNVDLIPLVLSQ